MPWLVNQEILARTDELEIPFNRHGIDPFGISRVEVARMMTILSWLYHHYFTVTIHGIDRVPARGRTILVGNHSGGFAVDGMMVWASMFLERDPPRLVHGMAERFMNRMPFASMYTSRTGTFTGTPEMALNLLGQERALLVFPEGARGTAKLYGDRNTLVRFGTGFMRLALQSGAPIVPFAFLGGGDAVPTVLNLKTLGRLVGVPYLPVTPYILPIPRPVKLELYYGEPMQFEGNGNEEDHVIDDYVAQVKRRIADMIHSGQRARLAKGLEP